MARHKTIPKTAAAKVNRHPPKLKSPKHFTVAAHYYSGMMLEAVDSIMHAHRLEVEAKRIQDDDSLANYDLMSNAGVYGRYGFLTACFAAEAGANALLESLPQISKSLVEDLEKLKTINKYEVFALVLSKPLDHGNELFMRMLQTIRLRNDFVHPKETKVEFASASKAEESQIIGRLSGGRSYPTSLDFFEPRHGIDLIRDILAFIAWVVFDTCGLSLEEGSRRLSRGIHCTTAILEESKYELRYDLRSFGIGSGYRGHQNGHQKS
jgi:hypothetical protein